MPLVSWEVRVAPGTLGGALGGPVAWKSRSEPVGSRARQAPMSVCWRLAQGHRWLCHHPLLHELAQAALHRGVVAEACLAWCHLGKAILSHLPSNVENLFFKGNSWSCRQLPTARGEHFLPREGTRSAHGMGKEWGAWGDELAPRPGSSARFLRVFVQECSNTNPLTENSPWAP